MTRMFFFQAKSLRSIAILLCCIFESHTCTICWRYRWTEIRNCLESTDVQKGHSAFLALSDSCISKRTFAPTSSSYTRPGSNNIRAADLIVFVAVLQDDIRAASFCFVISSPRAVEPPAVPVMHTSLLPPTANGSIVSHSSQISILCTVKIVPRQPCSNPTS